MMASEQCVFVRAKDSSHHIHLDAPQLVLDAVRKMILKLGVILTKGQSWVTRRRNHHLTNPRIAHLRERLYTGLENWAASPIPKIHRAPDAIEGVLNYTETSA